MSVIVGVTSMFYSVFMPTLPYVPPSEAVIWDTIYNIFGATSLAEDIQDATERAEAYYNVYQSILNNSNQALFNDIKNMIIGAKTNRKLSFTPSMVDTLQTAILKATTEG